MCPGYVYVRDDRGAVLLLNAVLAWAERVTVAVRKGFILGGGRSRQYVAHFLKEKTYFCPKNAVHSGEGGGSVASEFVE